MTNLRPKIVGGESHLIDSVMYFPSGIVCTLLVQDLNDSILRVDPASWPGGYRQIDTSLQDKRIELLWPSGVAMTGAQGTLRIVDEQGDAAVAPYSIHNSRPAIVGGRLRLVDRVMYYPDSAVCTLQVRDLNDSILKIDPTSWPGAYRQIDSSLEDKRIELLWPSGKLGLKSTGFLTIADPYGDTTMALYGMVKVFSDPLWSIPLAPHWAVYQPGDSSGYIRLGTSGQEDSLEFYFPRNSSAHGPSSLEIVTRFGLVGNFRWNLDWYGLKKFMRGGYSVGFTVSNSPDTSPYTGNRVEFSLHDEGTGLLMSLRGPNSTYENLTADDVLYSSPLRFERIGNEVHIMRKNLTGTFVNVYPLVDFLNFAGADPVYVHFKMIVTDFTEDRYLALRRYTIDQGEIVN